MRPDTARPFRLEQVQQRFCREVAGFAAVLQNPIENRSAPGIKSHAVDGVLGAELVADAVGLYQLDARLAIFIAGFVDEVFAVDVDAPANKRLALLE